MKHWGSALNRDVATPDGFLPAFSTHTKPGGDVVINYRLLLPYRLVSDFPERFGSIEDARAHAQCFFAWNNTEHRHSGIALLTPESVHYGRARHHRRERRDTARRVRREPIAFQEQAPASAGAAASRLDQPTHNRLKGVLIFPEFDSERPPATSRWLHQPSIGNRLSSATCSPSCSLMYSLIISSVIVPELTAR